MVSHLRSVAQEQKRIEFARVEILPGVELSGSGAHAGQILRQQDPSGRRRLAQHRHELPQSPMQRGFRVQVQIDVAPEIEPSVDHSRQGCS
jgi:hypothetical protein